MVHIYTYLCVSVTCTVSAQQKSVLSTITYQNEFVHIVLSACTCTEYLLVSTHIYMLIYDICVNYVYMHIQIHTSIHADMCTYKLCA